LQLARSKNSDLIPHPDNGRSRCYLKGIKTVLLFSAVEKKAQLPHIAARNKACFGMAIKR
jgi:hypothetical protein